MTGAAPSRTGVPPVRPDRAAGRPVCTVVSLLAALALATACATPAQEFEVVATGLEQPLGLTHAGDGSGRTFVIEQRGTVRVIADGALREEPYLDLRGATDAGGERGLLGLAFHPEFADNGRLFVHYTDLAGDTVLAEFQADGAAAAAVDPDTQRILLTVEQPYGNHNGGQIAFGPDGYLYMALGDGGSGGDPLDSGQDLGTLLGTLLRLDVDGEEPYAVPPDNPFVGVEGARDEIWAYGLRNPWRFSFDAATGDLWIADVGQNAVEEVNVQRADEGGGQNYGWCIMEGDRCFDPPQGCDTDGLTSPVVTYTHDSGWGRSITGGYVYRGSAAPDLQGWYVFSDYASGRIFATDAGSPGEVRELPSGGFNVSSFGVDEAGELYVLDHAGGRVLRFR